MSSTPTASAGPRVNYLRVSVTDRCNFRCQYCMPPEGVPALRHEDVLRYEEILRIARLALRLGVDKFRVTGGEPLVRKGIVGFVQSLGEVGGVRDLGMTTNGALLARFAGPLRDAGLRRVNVSLDTLRPERFRDLTRGGRLEDTLEGVREAARAGLVPVKLNVVLLRGFNDDEVPDFAALACREDVQVRFIEFMPVGEAGNQRGAGERSVPNGEVMAAIAARYALEGPEEGPGDTSTARTYRLPGGRGKVGFISPLSSHFCAWCNRLRLTPDGRLRACLLHDGDIDLRALLRGGASDDGLLAALREAVAHKHRIVDGFRAGSCLRKCTSSMSRIGG
ncbi:MAG: GTP 3',8-cyclase MoaA [Acidobacteria bacterium]|nr:GTP 3',8-cyclase MoaA [Acidobacteriota bacterium]